MRLVHKVRRRRRLKEGGGWIYYDAERVLIPIPYGLRELVRPWLGWDLNVEIEQFNLGFAALVYPENRLLGLYPLSQRFQYLLKQLEHEAGLNR